MQQLLKPTHSLVVPIYGNAGSIAPLLAAIADISAEVGGDFEAIFVVDGSPDESYGLLSDALPAQPFRSRLVALSRNFGAFSAIRVGLEKARGDIVAVMAADLQEPPSLVLEFFRLLRGGQHDVAFGVRQSRSDPWTSKLASGVFWAIYRRLVMPEIPKGGVDIFALSARFRDRLIAMQESNTSLLAQLFWLGGRRALVPYARLPRQHGRSGWTLAKKLRYLTDSVFAFTDLPVRLLFWGGGFALVVALVLGAVVLGARLVGWMEVVPGYTATMLTILFFGAINALGLGVVGTYAWRAFENTKARPLAVVQTDETFDGGAA